MLHDLKEDKEWLQGLKNQLTQMFDELQINYTEMSKFEVDLYMNRWFEEIVPKAEQKTAREHCFPTREYGAYLWHAFSYGYVSCTAGERAKAEFDKIDHGEAVLILNYEEIGFKLENSKGILADKLDDFKDVFSQEKTLTGRTFTRMKSIVALISIGNERLKQRAKGDDWLCENYVLHHQEKRKPTPALSNAAVLSVHTMIAGLTI